MEATLIFMLDLSVTKLRFSTFARSSLSKEALNDNPVTLKLEFVLKEMFSTLIFLSSGRYCAFSFTFKDETSRLSDVSAFVFFITASLIGMFKSFASKDLKDPFLISKLSAYIFQSNSLFVVSSSFLSDSSRYPMFQIRLSFLSRILVKLISGFSRTSDLILTSLFASPDKLNSISSKSSLNIVSFLTVREML